MTEVDPVVAAMVRAPLAVLSADEREVLAKIDSDPARWLTTEEIRASLGDSPRPRLAG